MKILKIKLVDGFRMLPKNFVLNFLTKTRIIKDSDNTDLLKLADNLYFPIETAFIGKNSSGKTTILEAFNICANLLSLGRIPNIPLLTDTFRLEITFFNNGMIYLYKGEYVNNSNNNYYLTIKNESLQYSKINATLKKDLSNVNFKDYPGFEPNINMDTSNIMKVDFKRELGLFLNRMEKDKNIYNIILDNIPNALFKDIIQLFDDSIEYISYPKDENGVPIKNNTYVLKRINSKEMIYNLESLENMLSSGTIRGIKFYSIAILAFKIGGTLIVDEIEKNFNKNLIFNLIDMFNDERINKKGATLIYSTHYSEILDNSSRCDNINVVHRNKDVISCKNMSTDYNLRTELKKSDQFEQNAFDTFINYDQLMKLKKNLRG